MNLMNLFIPLTKVDAVQRLVYGTLVAEEVDKTGEIFDYASSKPHVEEWSGGIAKATDGKSLGNLRAMHGKVAAGKFTQLVCNDETKSVEVCAKVVDDAEWAKVDEGVYTGFSIGGSYVRKWKDGEHMRYEAKPSEGSLVDNPCGPGAHFTMVKADGSTELRKFHEPAVPSPATTTVTSAPAVTPAADPELEQVWKAKDGRTFATKALAKAHNDEVAAAAAAANEPTAKLAASIAKLEATVAKAETAQAVPVVPLESLSEAGKSEFAKTGKTPIANLIAKKDFTDDERKAAADKGEAMPDGGFPIQSKADLANAIQAFGRAKNQKSTKAHIIKRATDLGATDALPDAWKPGAEKALVFGELRKGMYGVSRLACIIEDLEYLQQSTEYEATAENDGSTMPTTLKQLVAQLGAALRSMVEEETNELLTNDEAIEFGEMLEMSARPHGIDALAKVLGDKAPAYLAKVGARKSKTDQEHMDAAHDHLSKMGIGCGAGADKAVSDTLGKAGARHSKVDHDNLTNAHDSLTAAGAQCPDDADEEDDKSSKADPKADKAAPAGDLAKALERNTQLEKTMLDTTEKLATLQKQVEKLLDQERPDPRDRAFRIVHKSADEAVAETYAAEIEQVLEDSKSDPMAAAKFLMRKSQSNPQKMVPTR